MIAFLDVDYRPEFARAACVLVESWLDSTPCTTYVCDIEKVAPYEPGMFYRRELPCLLAVLNQLPKLPEVMVVDGYVWLASSSRPGLGAHLYQALSSQIPVVGVAKKSFVGSECSSLVQPVFRGVSQSPLFVSSVGFDLSNAASMIVSMHGVGRIPTLLRLVDRLARS